MSPILRPTEAMICSAVLAPVFGIAYLWHITYLPIIDLGYEHYQASSFDQAAGYYAFSDIRYAAPPLGDLRFQPPAPIPENRAFLQQGDRLSRICPQAKVSWGQDPGFDIRQGIVNGTIASTYDALDSSPGIQTDAIETEDCLFLDVFVPQTVFKTRRQIAPGAPVLVWIHAGEGISGSKAFPIQPFELLKHGHLTNARPDTILVSINYRLGAFAWQLDDGEKVDDGEEGSAAAVAAAASTASIRLQDRHTALHWVRTKIHLFGGDAGRLTITGGGTHDDEDDPIDSAARCKRLEAFPGAAAAAAGGKDRFPHHRAPDQQTVGDFFRLANVSGLSGARASPSERLVAANRALMEGISGKPPRGCAALPGGDCSRSR